MPDFDYLARELSGKQVTGTVSAASETDALSSLAGKNLFPIKVSLSAASKKQAEQGSKRVAPRHLTVFYNQLADLLRSGVPLLRSLQLLEEQTSNATLKTVIQDVREQVADGSRLNDAMRRHPKTFNNLTVSMVKAGEEGSFLEEVLARIAMFNDHQEELKGRVTGAMVYPLFLLLVGTGIVVVMMVWFVPKFAAMFDRMKSQGNLPWATTALMAISDGLQKWWMLIAIVLVGAIVGAVTWMGTPDGQKITDRWKLKIPDSARFFKASLSLVSAACWEHC